MLVLALQFSKGIADVGIVTEHAHRARRGSGAVARAVREGRPCGRLPQNGREDKVRRFEREGGRILNFAFISTEPTSAPTGNWFEPGRTNAYQRLNSSSLERR